MWVKFMATLGLVTSMAPNPIKCIGFGDIYGPKPYKFIGLGDIYGPKPYKFIGFGDIYGPKRYKFIGFGDIQHAGYLQAFWPKNFGSDFGRISAKRGPETSLERRGSSCSTGCTKNQPGRPILKPFRGAKQFRPDCLQVPS